MKFLYLHGFASSPSSTKANFFFKHLDELSQDIEVLDLNGANFTELKISLLIENIKSQYNTYEKITLIGSSMGGLVALNLAESMPNIQKVILLAPALKINTLWPKIVGEVGMQFWHDKGYLPIYHYGMKQEINLHYEFITDLQQIRDDNFKRNIPALIFHGLNDVTIPCQVSSEYSASHPCAVLHLLDSDHSLEDSLLFIWQHVAKFLELE